MHPSWNDYPKLLAELHPTKNVGLTFHGKPIEVLQLAIGTGKRLWWICSLCENVWKTPGSNRIVGKGCSVCVNNTLHSDGRNSMAKTHSDLAKEYEGDASIIVAGTSKKLPWKCSTCSNKWNATGNSRVGGSGCSFCNRGDLHSDNRNSMAKTRPKLAEEYQGDASKIIASTMKQLNWKCLICENRWSASGDNRVRAETGCPACKGHLHSDRRNSMAKTHPELAKEYQGNASEIIAGTNKKLPWKCSICANEWNATGTNRKNHDRGCPACANQFLHSDGRNSMANTHPELAKEYQGDAAVIIAGTGKKLPWKCSVCEHNWNAVGASRVNGAGCGACQGRLHSDGRNSMENTHPELAKEYQGDPSQITATSDENLPWKCATCNYSWIARSRHRSDGVGCPACAKYGYNPSKIGYVYIHHYEDEIAHWLKCGITNDPEARFLTLSKSAKKSNITINQFDVFKFDDGFNAQQCERELLKRKDIRYNSNYDIDGKAEFFKYEALDEIKSIIENWL